MVRVVAGTKTNGFGWATREVVERIRSITRLEVELALLEVKQKFSRIGAGIGMGAGAAVLALYALGFFFAGGAVALALVLPLWAALLIVGAILLLTALVLVLLARSSIRAGTPPLPEEAIEEARRTTETLRANGS
jgi:hypothetical protein